MRCSKTWHVKLVNSISVLFTARHKLKPKKNLQFLSIRDSSMNLISNSISIKHALQQNPPKTAPKSRNSQHPKNHGCGYQLGSEHQGLRSRKTKLEKHKHHQGTVADILEAAAMDWRRNKNAKEKGMNFNVWEFGWTTHLQNISQNGNLPQVRVKKRWNHHLVLVKHWCFLCLSSKKVDHHLWGHNFSFMNIDGFVIYVTI